jgi:predicted nucleic acid-binding protein
MMFFFLDGSALAKRYVIEVGSALVHYLLDNVSASRLIVLNIGFAEVVSILVRRRNAGKLSPALFSQGLIELSQEIIHAASLRKVEPTNSLVIASLAHIPKHSVNSTDAIALHAAQGLAQNFRAKGDNLTLVASDQRLVRAAKAEGLITFNPETEDLTVVTALAGP